MYSEKQKRLEAIKYKQANNQGKKKKVKINAQPLEDDDDSDDEKVKLVKALVEEASQPQRDCKKFDPVKRAKEIFNAK